MSMAAQGVDDFRAAVARPHVHTREALDDPSRHGSVAVAWCSAHLAAVDLVLYPAALRAVPERRREVRAARAVDHRLQQALCRLDRRLTGGSSVDRVPFATLHGRVREALRVHEEAERELVDALSSVLSPGELHEMAQRLACAMDAAPRRPHPHTRHTPLAPLVAWCDALADRVRDAMDNRVAPFGRPRCAVRPPSRWGSYFLGVPYPERSRRIGR